MPEMPEVETLVRQLRKSLVGKQVRHIYLSGLPLRKPILGTFAVTLEGRTIRKILRRGKYIVIELEPKAFWLIHLGMSGRLLYRARAVEAAGHTQAVFLFSDSSAMEYRDPRRFGLLAAYEGLQLGRIPEIRSLGLDPVSAGFSKRWLWDKLQRSRQEIKSFLLDQRKIAGLGNIYVCESLFLAGIHPARRCFTLTFGEAGRLVNAIRTVLRTAVRNCGTSFSDFMDSEGKSGQNQTCLAVFQREGAACVRCGAPVCKMRQGNRSSFYCAYCQG
jgi:formamidopyrimidine-DNA glycosylase